MQKLLQSPIFRSSIRQQNPQNLKSQTSNFSSFSDHTYISNEVLALINSSSTSPIFSSLTKISSFLNREIVISVLQSQSQSQDPKITFRFFIWSSHLPRFRSGVSHNVIVNMLVKNQVFFDSYWSVLDELKADKLPVSADAFVVLILAYWKVKNAEKAVEAFSKMREYDCVPNLAAFNVVLDVLVKKDVILLALAVYNVMLKSNVKMGCDTFGVLIDGLCKSGMTEDALRLFDEMSERGISPNGITYTVIMSGLCKAKRTGDAFRLFNLMKENGCVPDSATYNALLDGFCKCEQIEEAFVLFKTFREEGYSVGIRGFTSVIDGLIRAKRLGDAEELFKKVSDAGLVPDVVLYSIMMRGLSEAGRMEEAIGMLRGMIEKGVTPDTGCYNALIKGFCDVGLLDQARSLKLEISHSNLFPNTQTYTILICGSCRNGLLIDAQQIFDDMEKFGCSPSAVTFNALIDGLCKAGRLDEACKMLFKMEISKNPSLFLRLSQGSHGVLDKASLQKSVEDLVNSGLILKAYRLLKQLADSGVDPNIRTYNILINGMCKGGQVDIGLKLLEELQLKRIVPDSVTYATLIEGLQRENREELAYTLFTRMTESGCKPCSAVYKSLMTWSCRRSKISDAFSLWLNYLRDVAGREGEALKLSEEYFEKGELEKAVRSLLEMDVKLKDFDSSPYNIWLVGLCQANRVEEAIKTFSVLEEFSVVVSAACCVKFIDALCSKGQFSKAVEIFIYTMEKGYKLMPPICNNLLTVLLRSKNESSLAYELIDKMKSSGYDLNSYLHHNTKFLLRNYYSAREMENVSSG